MPPEPHPLRLWPLLVAMILWLAGCSDPTADPVNTAKWPERPIQISCFSSAGGGTDAVNRLIARAMESRLGVKINVVNRTAARGGATLNYVWNHPRNGYAWGGFSESILPAPLLGIHPSTAKDWTYFLVAGAPGVLSVSTDSPIQTIEEFLAQGRAAGNDLKVAASSTGGIWHTKMLSLQEASGSTFHYIPFAGSQKSQTAVLTGEVDAVLTSLAEQAELIRGGKLRPLAMIESDAEELAGHGEIASVSEVVGPLPSNDIRQWLGFALPADTPADILATVTAAFTDAMSDPEIRQYAETSLLKLYGVSGDEANTIVREGERVWGWMLHDLGIVSTSPESLGIPRP